MYSINVLLFINSLSYYETNFTANLDINKTTLIHISN